MRFFNSSSGNSSAFFGVFFDSFAKIAISVSVLATQIGLTDVIVYQQIMPGLCFSLFILNFCYYYQAKRLSLRLNRVVTAIPCGLQANCVFVWLFAIMLPLTAKTSNPVLAYQVALVANLINAIVFTLTGVILYKFKRLIPPPALIGSLAGSAFTWLAVNNLENIFNHPISGVLPLLLLLILLLGKFKPMLSPVVLGIILGSGLALITGEISPALPTKNLLQFTPPHFYAVGLFTPQIMHYIMGYLPLIASFAIIDAISAVQILEETKISGDEFNPYSTLLISGLISGGSALLGNPFAMALFFGHASWKKVKATHSYALWIGIAFLLLGSFGLIPLIIAYIPDWVTLPVLIFIGISTASLCFATLDKQYYPIIIIAIIPILIEMVCSKLELIAIRTHLNELTQPLGGKGLLILAKGSILFSIGLTSLLVYIMQRQWLMAMLTSLVLLFLSSIGFIHAQTPGLYLISEMNLVYIALAGFCFGGYLWHKKYPPQL